LNSFTILIRRYQDVVQATALGILGEKSAAEDVAQETFLYAWTHLQQLREPAAFVGWLRQIVFSQCSRTQRKHRSHTRIDEINLIDTATPEAQLLKDEQFQRVMRPIEALPDTLRLTICLFYLADCSVADIASILEVNAGAVRKRLHDARSRLRSQLTELELKMTRDNMHDNRPSKDEAFINKVVAVLQAAASGDSKSLSDMLNEDDALANASGPHPIWSGNPQPLHVAAERGHLDVVRQLLDQGADANGKDADYDGWSPLMLAAHGGRLGIHSPREAIVSLLRDTGATVDVFSATLLNDISSLSELLRSDPQNATRQGPADATALHFARSAEAAGLLLESGANPNALCGWGTTPLERAAFCGASGIAVAEVLITAGAQCNACILACLGDLKRLSALLDTDPEETRSRHKVGASIVGEPVHAAANHGQIEIMQFLIDKGADINARADMGQTPLHLATTLEMVQLLAENGADTTARDDDHGTPPLEWARFFHEHLDPENAELPRIITYLETKPS
jgi:RNA polymerase sigma factor (sigma-70 family)